MKVCGITSKTMAIVMEGSPGRLKGRLVDIVFPFVCEDRELVEEEKAALASQIKDALDKCFVFEDLTEEQFARLKKLSTEVHTATGKTISRLIQKRYDFIYSSLAIAVLLSQLKDVIASVSRLLPFKAPREKRIEAIQPLFEEILPNLAPVTACFLPYSLERAIKEIRKTPKAKSDQDPVPAETLQTEETSPEPEAHAEQKAETETEKVEVEA